MQRARINHAQTVAVPRPQVAVTNEWVAATVAVVLLLVGLLGP